MKIRKPLLPYLLVFLFCLPVAAQQKSVTVNLEALKGEFSKVSSDEMKLMLEDVSEAARQKMKDDPQFKAKQVGSVREMMALAIQAIKDGIAAEPPVKNELAFLSLQIVAVQYSRVLEPKGKGLAAIPAKMVTDFYAAPENVRFFNEFLAMKQAFFKLTDPDPPAMTAADIAEIKDYFAKINILFVGYVTKAAELGERVSSKMSLGVRLQNAQMLAKIYSERVLTPKTAVTEEEIDQYIVKHPEFSTAAQKQKANELLRRALAGEDFAGLAGQYSEDPGSKAAGGLYANVPKGQFLPEIESAAYALKPSEISPAVVESMLGFHVIKLEKKTPASLSFRHILISTTINNPEKPAIGGPETEGVRPIPYRQFLRTSLEEEKESRILADILASNPVEIGDF